MTKVVDRWMIDPSKAPGLRVNPGSELELLPPVQIPVGEIPNRFDGRASIHSAAVQPRHKAGLPVRIAAACAFDIFEVVLFALNNNASDSRQVRILLEGLDRCRKEPLMEPHVAVDQADIFARAILIAKLCACAATAIFRPV